MNRSLMLTTIFCLLVITQPVFAGIGFSFTQSSGFDSTSSPSTSPDTLPNVSKIFFDWQLYLGINHDLPAAGILTSESAQTHWLQQGIFECRRSALVFDPNYYKKLLVLDLSANVINHQLTTKIVLLSVMKPDPVFLR